MSCGAAPAPTAAPPSLPPAKSGKKTSSAQNPGGDEASAAAAAAATAPANSNDQASLNYLAQLRSASALLEAVIDALQAATQVRQSVQSVQRGYDDDVEWQITVSLIRWFWGGLKFIWNVPHSAWAFH